MSEIGNHCLNCGNADIYCDKLGQFLSGFCQKRVEKLFTIEADCPDFEPKGALRALMEIFNEDTDKD